MVKDGTAVAVAAILQEWPLEDGELFDE